jgi:hypothetical protein
MFIERLFDVESLDRSRSVSIGMNDDLHLTQPMSLSEILFDNEIKITFSFQ